MMADLQHVCSQQVRLTLGAVEEQPFYEPGMFWGVSPLLAFGVSHEEEREGAEFELDDGRGVVLARIARPHVLEVCRIGMNNSRLKVAAAQLAIGDIPQLDERARLVADALDQGCLPEQLEL